MAVGERLETRVPVAAQWEEPWADGTLLPDQQVVERMWGVDHDGRSIFVSMTTSRGSRAVPSIGSSLIMKFTWRFAVQIIALATTDEQLPAAHIKRSGSRVCSVLSCMQPQCCTSSPVCCQGEHRGICSSPLLPPLLPGWKQSSG